MPKSRKPVSYRRKKQRITPGLQRFNEERRKNAARNNRNFDEELIEEHAELNVQQMPVKDNSKVEYEICGRRIVDIAHTFEQIKSLDIHDPFDCTFRNMKLISEKREGLRSGFVFKCLMCNIVKTIWSEVIKPNAMDVNTAAVSGTISTGGGHAQLEEMLSAMNIPPVSNKTFLKYENIVSQGWMTTAEQEMKSAAEEEARLARERGEVDTDGVPLITVVADGSWCKRSYRTNYSSLSGVAAVVGHRTRKVLFLGVKNKYCTPCAQAERKGEQAKQHACYKNWNKHQSSSSMEAAIICDGFNQSEDMYGIRYAELIADGDSSVYKKIVESRPYKSLTVKKIECKNHLLRNLCNKLKVIAQTSTRQINTVTLRKKIGENIMRCRVAVTKAAAHRREEDVPEKDKIKLLRDDILNIPSHVFGEHKMCDKRGYFCELNPSSAPPNGNIVPALISASLYQQISDVFRDLSRHSRSLIIDVTSNSVEHYNSIIAKYIGGKRINFALRGSYRGRCSAAVVQYNTGKAHYKLHKVMYKSSPGCYTKSTENKRKRKTELGRSRKRCRKSLFDSTSTAEDRDYGNSAQRPDIDNETMETESKEFLESLKKSHEEIIQIERETVEQSDCTQWLELRRNMITASNFGRICKMKSTTGCESLVKKLLYSTFDCDAMAYGRKHEDTARKQAAELLEKTIEPCGLTIDQNLPFLGATPDGFIDEDGLIEIKCPSSGKDLTPDEAIKAKKVTFWSCNKAGEIGDIQQTHNFYYQIQGQLNITKRKYCQFVLWTPKGMKIEKIEQDELFWQTNMIPTLTKFYMNCVLPELIDPRHRRSMPIRNPSYIVEARKKLEENKTKKQNNKR